jgi:hypothetical protein
MPTATSIDIFGTFQTDMDLIERGRRIAMLGEALPGRRLQLAFKPVLFDLLQFRVGLDEKPNDQELWIEIGYAVIDPPIHTVRGTVLVQNASHGPPDNHGVIGADEYHAEDESERSHRPAVID